MSDDEREQFRGAISLIANFELLKLDGKGVKDERWLFDCWYAYKNGVEKWRKYAEDFEKLLIEAYEDQKPGLFLTLARKRKAKEKTLRGELLRALITLSATRDPTWSQVRAMVEPKLKRDSKTWERERKRFPFLKLPD